MSHPGGRGGGRRRSAGRDHFEGAILVLVVVVIFAVAAVAVGVVAVGRGSSGVTYLAGPTFGRGSVTVRFDPVTGKASVVLADEVSVVAPDGREAAGLSASSNKIDTANLATGRVSPAVRVGPAPYAAVFGAGDRRLYVAEAGSAAYFQPDPHVPRPGHTVTVIGVRANRVEATIDVCTAPTALAVSTAEHVLVVACAKQVALIDTRTDRVVGTFDLPLGPYLVAVSPSGGEAVAVSEAVGDGGGGVGRLLVVPIDLRTRRAGGPVTIAASTPTYSAIGASSLTFRPGDNDQVWVTSGQDIGAVEVPTVYRVDLARRTVSGPLRLDGHLVGAVHFWPNGTAGYIASPRPGKRGHLVATSLAGPAHLVHLSPSPARWRFTAQAPYLVVTPNFERVSVVDLATGTTRVWPLTFFPGQLWIAS